MLNPQGHVALSKVCSLIVDRFLCIIIVVIVSFFIACEAKLLALCADIQISIEKRQDMQMKPYTRCLSKNTAFTIFLIVSWNTGREDAGAANRESGSLATWHRYGGNVSGSDHDEGESFNGIHLVR